MRRKTFKIVGIVLVAALVVFQRYEVMIKKHELALVQHELNWRENEVRMLMAREDRRKVERTALLPNSVAKPFGAEVK